MSKLPSSKKRLRLAAQYIKAVIDSVLEEACEEYHVSRKRVLRRVFRKLK